MFTFIDSPTGQFTLLPFPAEFFDTASPFGNGALLLLNQFANNSAVLRAAHVQGILIAAAQASATFGTGFGALEVYGLTDRTGSEALNLELSTRRAQAALSALSSAMALGSTNVVFSNGLGERFADEYFQKADNTRDAQFRGVACYLWESFSTAIDPILRLNVSFAAPPTGGGGKRRLFLGALHMGRLRAQPRPPFA